MLWVLLCEFVVSCDGRARTVCLCLVLFSVQEMENVNEQHEQQQEDLQPAEVVHIIVIRVIVLACHCPRGSDGLYYVRLSLFFSVTMTTHELLHSA